MIWIKQRIVISLGYLGRIIQVRLELFLQGLPLFVVLVGRSLVAPDIAGHQMELLEEGVDVDLVLGHEALLDLGLGWLGVRLDGYPLLI